MAPSSTAALWESASQHFMLSSPTQDTRPDTPPPGIASMPTTPLQPISLAASLQTQGRDSMSSPAPRSSSTRSSLSPADCRTLLKILEDVRTPSPLSAPRFNAAAESPLPDKQFEYGDERDEAYDGENSSMEPSDVDGAYEAEAEAEEEDEDGDAIEDVMNLPGQMAPPTSVQNLSSFYIHDHHTPDDSTEARLRRVLIEDQLVQDCIEQGRRQADAAADDLYGDHAPLDRMQFLGLDGASRTSPGGVVSMQKDSIEQERRDETPVFQALEKEIGMHAVEDEEATACELGPFEGYGSSLSPSILSSSYALRASEETPLPSTSFIVFSDTAPAVVQTPGGKHIEFAPASTIPDTPFTKTLNYFKQYKGKENSPSKRRRNASSPEEIAELAREARVEEEEAEEQADLQNLEQYRDMDLAPLEPVMESGSAGDLITCGTPRPPGSDLRPTLLHSPGFASGMPSACTSPSRQDPIRTMGSDTEDWVTVKKPQGSPRCLALPVEQDSDEDADVEGSDAFERPEQTQLILYPQHPTFVTVIGMLPGAMFWATAAPVVKYGNKTFDALVEKLTGLKV